MISSAAPPGTARSPRGGAAEAHARNTTMPRRGDSSAGRGDRTTPQHERTPNEQPYQQRREPDRPDERHVEVVVPEGAGPAELEGWEEVTALAPEAVNEPLLRAELHEVLARHGLADPHVVDDVTVHLAAQGGRTAGVTVAAYHRPTDLPDAPAWPGPAADAEWFAGDIARMTRRIREAS